MSEQLQQGTKEWFEERKGRITGSRVGAILGLSPFASRNDVMREMVREHFGSERELKGNVATNYGNEHEDTAIAQYEAETGSLVVSTGFHTLGDMLGASPDGLVGEDGLIEIKCPYSKKIKPISEQHHYGAQVQMELLCTGRKWCDFVTWTPNAMTIERVERDSEWLLSHESELTEFYQNYLATIECHDLSAPHLEDLIKERNDDKWKAFAATYIEAKQLLDAAKLYELKCKKDLLEMAAGKKTHGFGLLVYPVSGRKTIKYQEALNKLAPDADLSEFTKQGAQSWSIRIEK